MARRVAMHLVDDNAQVTLYIRNALFVPDAGCD
eukprot:COSAG06_NODE_42775_length_378_cov_1.408602_2_plen_32_part_01